MAAPPSTTSETDICNAALTRLGAARITSLTEDSNPARVCNDQFAKTRDALLASQPWNFATTYSGALSKKSGAPAWNWSSWYVLPTGTLSVWETNAGAEAAWEIANDPDDVTGGQVIMVNVSSLKIRYTYRMVDYTRWSPIAIEALVSLMGKRLASAITGDVGWYDRMGAEHELVLLQAMQHDGNQGTPKQAAAPQTFTVIR